jgi:hypothetical protein
MTTTFNMMIANLRACNVACVPRHASCYSSPERKRVDVYEGPFTRMATARSERLPVISVGVMEVD